MPSTDTSPLPEPGHWRVFSAAPHRMMFFAGAVQAALIMLLWLAELAGRAGWWAPLPTVIPSTWVHAFLMLYGLFPFFIFGFLLTVYPRWMGGPTVPASRYVAAFGFLAAGMIYFISARSLRASSWRRRWHCNWLAGSDSCLINGFPPHPNADRTSVC